jgi:hypothetical protein
LSALVTGWVLRHSPVAGAARLVLIVLADRADHEGRNAYPSVSSIANDARCSESTVHRVLRELEAAGHIVREGVSHRRTTMYRVAMQEMLAPSRPSDDGRVAKSEGGPISGADPSDPETGTSDGRTEVPPTIGPEPSVTVLEPSEEPARVGVRAPAPPMPPDTRGMPWQQRRDAEAEHRAQLAGFERDFRDFARQYFPGAAIGWVKLLVQMVESRGFRGGESTLENLQAYAEAYHGWRSSEDAA